ncbi:MAG: hypothetical protein NTW75_10155 [Planctomycetales bacterium]|jgi:hypothetical protein|nr:hypothetical protein [Planctomycetales bacterium]
MWTLTTEYTDDPLALRHCSCNYDEAKASLLKYPFRLLDDDGGVYYEGLSDDDSSQEAFAPLDDFGEGYAGCVTIEYFRQGQWEPLLLELDDRLTTFPDPLQCSPQTSCISL